MSATECGFTLGGTPPNWGQGAWYGHWAKAYQAKLGWLERAIMTGRQARIKEGWAICPDELRAVEIRCYRVQLMDHDGATTSIKPILDGLKVSLRRKEKTLRKMIIVPGAGLVYDDRPENVWLAPPGNLQVKVYHRSEERTVVVVKRDMDWTYS